VLVRRKHRPEDNKREVREKAIGGAKKKKKKREKKEKRT